MIKHATTSSAGLFLACVVLGTLSCRKTEVVEQFQTVVNRDTTHVYPVRVEGFSGSMVAESMYDLSLSSHAGINATVSYFQNDSVVFQTTNRANGYILRGRLDIFQQHIYSWTIADDSLKVEAEIGIPIAKKGAFKYWLKTKRTP